MREKLVAQSDWQEIARKQIEEVLPTGCSAVSQTRMQALVEAFEALAEEEASAAQKVMSQHFHGKRNLLVILVPHMPGSDV